MLESSSVLSRLQNTRGRLADAGVTWLNFSVGLRIVYHFSPELTLDRGRENVVVSPPSEPDMRISRIRLSSWWFTS